MNGFTARHKTLGQLMTELRARLGFVTQGAASKNNDTIIKTDDRYYVPLDVVDDDALRKAGLRFAAGDNAEHFTSRPYVPDLRKAS